MSIEWSKGLSTGVDWQDKHHKELFRRVNLLLSAMDAGYGREEVMKLLIFLDEYVVVHFDAEEQAMHAHAFPDSLSHIEEHTRFIEDVARLEKEAGDALTASLVIQVQRRVVDWLLNHVGGPDKALGRYIRGREGRRA